MIDFSKLPRSLERRSYLLRCSRCGEEAWHTIDLPEHLVGHERVGGVGARCGGRWEKIAEGYERNDPAAWEARSRHHSAMKTRSEAKAERERAERAEARGEADPPTREDLETAADAEAEDRAEKEARDRREIEEAARRPPKNPFRWPSAHRKEEETDLREDLVRVVETIFVDDIHGTWRDLEKALQLGEKRSEHGHAVRALDRVATQADRAYRLYLTAKLAREKWEAENEAIWGGMWTQATHALQAEKDAGTRSKQITDADVKARVATLYPDQYRAQEERRRSVELTVRALERLADLWFKRMGNLDQLVSKLRG